LADQLQRKRFVVEPHTTGLKQLRRQGAETPGILVRQHRQRIPELLMPEERLGGFRPQPTHESSSGLVHSVQAFSCYPVVKVALMREGKAVSLVRKHTAGV